MTTRAPTLFFVALVAACGDDGGAQASTTGTTGSTGGSTGTVTADGSGSGSAEASSTAGTSTAGSSGTADSSGSTGAPQGPPCAAEDDCFGDTPHCDAALGVCVGCGNDDECRGETLCDVATGQCRDCVTDADCDPEAPICDFDVSGQCTASCTADADCANTGGPDKCDTTRGVCVDCTGNGQDCTFCELVTYSCVGCLVDGDCPPAAPLCSPSLECSPMCTADDNCPSNLVCDPDSLRCVECFANLHCPGEICQPNFTCG